MQAGPLLSLSPSFNSYSSSGKLADIATRVVNEFRKEYSGGSSSNSSFAFDPIWESLENSSTTHFLETSSTSNPDVQIQQSDENDEEFEFPSIFSEPNSSSISADEIFYNGQIKPIYPVFNKNVLLYDDHGFQNKKGLKDDSKPPTSTTRRRQPLRKLMIEEEREAATTSSFSFETDELEGLPPESFCVWVPKNTATDESTRNCKKISSTGSSKRWRLRNFLNRSNSLGKDTFVLLSVPNKNKTEMGSSVNDVNAGKETEMEFPGAGEELESNEGGDCTCEKKKEEDKRKTLLLPYKKDIMGILTNVNGLSRNLRPF